MDQLALEGLDSSSPHSGRAPQSPENCGVHIPEPPQVFITHPSILANPPRPSPADDKGLFLAALQKRASVWLVERTWDPREAPTRSFRPRPGEKEQKASFPLDGGFGYARGVGERTAGSRGLHSTRQGGGVQTDGSTRGRRRRKREGAGLKASMFRPCRRRRRFYYRVKTRSRAFS